MKPLANAMFRNSPTHLDISLSIQTRQSNALAEVLTTEKNVLTIILLGIFMSEAVML